MSKPHQKIDDLHLKDQFISEQKYIIFDNIVYVVKCIFI